jgi:nitroreductase
MPGLDPGIHDLLIHGQKDVDGRVKPGHDEGKTDARESTRGRGMEFETLVQTRKSVRGFKKKPVPRAVIEEILEVAKRAPSSMNTQPWHVHVLTGEPLEEVRRRNMEEMAAGARPKRDIISHGEYQGVHRVRQVDIAKKLFGAMGIARDDKPMRQDWVLRGFRQFDAPVSLVLAYDRELDPGAVVHFDLGALCYGIVLAAWDRGLGSVINGQGIMRSDIVRKVAKIPESQVIMTCVAMGYPDDSFAANGVRSDREANGDFVRYVGFAD